jgi:DNA-binding NtrC family response regulator
MIVFPSATEETSIELRRIRPDVKIILSSGYHEQDAIQQFVGQTGTVFLQKPYRSMKLVELVHEVLDLKVVKQKR